MNTSLDKAYILIDKYHSGQASRQEELWLENWKSDTIKNAKIFDEIIQILDVLKTLQEWKNYDQNKGWGLISTKTNLKILRFPFAKILSIASIFLLVLTATIWLYNDKAEAIVGEYLKGDEISFSVLEDGTEVFFDKNAKINILDFKGTSRHLKSSGSYFLNVHQDEKHPFKISMRDLDLEVKGTSFYIEETEKISKVIVREGLVSIKTKRGLAYDLKQNEMLWMDGEKIQISKVQNFEWGLINKEYDDASIFSLLNDISEKYGNLKIHATNIDATCRVTTKISHSTIIEILEELSLIFKLEYTIKNGTIVVKSISC